MMGVPLSPSEIARRAEIAASARAMNGASHQNEPILQAVDDEELPASSPVDVWLPDEGGVRRWRPVIDRVDVVKLPNGERLLVVGNGLRIKLPEAAAKHLGKLLYGGQP